MRKNDLDVPAGDDVGWGFFDTFNKDLGDAREQDGTDHDVVAAAYAKVFGTPEGAVVFEDLKRVINQVPGFNPALGYKKAVGYGFYREGMNDLVRHVIQTIASTARSK